MSGLHFMWRNIAEHFQKTDGCETLPVTKFLMMTQIDHLQLNTNNRTVCRGLFYSKTLQMNSMTIDN